MILFHIIIQKDKEMIKKTITMGLLVIGFSTTGIMANGTSSELSELTFKQERLSAKIIAAYQKQDQGISALALIDTLESEQTKLKSKIDDPKMHNLLTFLSMCVSDLKTAVKKPYNSQNAQCVADLSTSIQEGSHYIGQSI